MIFVYGAIKDKFIGDLNCASRLSFGLDVFASMSHL